MAFVISYPLSTRGHAISPRADRLRDDILMRADKGYDVKNDML